VRRLISRPLAFAAAFNKSLVEILSAGRIEREGLRAALQFFGRITVSVHNALNRVIASRTGKNL
jgi:hypothetical protein